jgi:hypothetical protein
VTRPDATLVSFGTGEVFARYLTAMFATAERWFFPGRAQLLELDTTPAWPYAARDRWTHMLNARRKIRGRFVFLLDADALFEGPVDDEIVADGITAVLHPVQNALPLSDMTYERNPHSPAYVPEGEGGRYYVGGILGAPRDTFLDLCKQVDAMCQQDGDNCPTWQDEGYINRILIDHPPALELDGRYCAWPTHNTQDVRIRVIDKTPDEFHWRNTQRKEAAPA